MLKTFKHLKTGLFLMLAMFFLLNNVFAQSIIFSSDKWPKRWERAMHQHFMNGPIRQRQRNYENHSLKTRNGFQKVAQQGGRGKQPEKMRHEHKRSRTPEYHNGSHHRYDEDPLKRRYALPDTRYGLYGQGAYPNGFYGSSVPVIPHLPAAVYPAPIYGGYPGAYPGIYPGLGMPGMYSVPGFYPHGSYPGFGYPW